MAVRSRPAASCALDGKAILIPGVCAYWALGFAQQVLGASRVAASGA